MARAGSPPMSADAFADPSAPTAMSKRDKRRTMLSDRLNQMVANFSHNLRPHYDSLSNAIQVDIALIMREHPYDNKPLDDDPDTISQKVSEITGGKVPADEVAVDGFNHDVGREYTKFIHEVNNAIEEKDVNLTLLAEKHENTRRELIHRHFFHSQVAREEHKALAQSMRERLLSQMNKKRERLLREKEQLEIGDSHALLLHPSHFSLTNPSSPGGGHKRATRNTGRRGADLDEQNSYDSRRKRKAYMDDLEQSPAPTSRYDGNGLGAASSSRARAAYNQFEAPVYSFNELFTESELQMAMNNSVYQVQQYMLDQTRNNGLPDDGINGSRTTGQAGGAASTTAGDGDDDVTPAPLDMERTASQAYHHTRGVTRSALSELAAAAVTRDILGSQGLPTIVIATRGQKANGAPAITNLSQAEIEHDMSLFTGNRPSESDMNDSLRPAKPTEYQYDPKHHHQRLMEPHELLSSLNPATAAMAMGGVPMSAQSSMAGFSDAAHALPPPMSRQTSQIGGISMKRTASGAGDGRRVRSRMQ